MAVLQDARRGGAAGVELGQDVLARIAGLFWRWYHGHKNDALLRKKIAGIFSVTIKVRDLAPLFVQLFGPDPTVQAGPRAGGL